MNRIVIAGENLSDAIELGGAAYIRNRDRKGVFKNTWQGHVVSKLGEIAAEVFALGRGWPVQPIYRDPEREPECDLIVRNERVEVKTWSFRSWEKYGRALAELQYPSIKRKAEVVFWMVVVSELARDAEQWRYGRVSELHVEVKGWSFVREFDDIKAELTTSNAAKEVWNRRLDSVGRKIRPFSTPRSIVAPAATPSSEEIVCPSVEEVFK